MVSMSISIFQYTYKSLVEDFTIFAPVKHGTRWLNDTEPTTITALHPPHILSKILFSDNKKLIIKNPVFVYRDPYDAFINAILTGVHNLNESNSKQISPTNSDYKFLYWDGDPKTLDVVMLKNGHFYPNHWQKIWEILEPLHDTSIVFVELRNLSDYMILTKSKYYKYNFDSFSFEKSIVNNFTKEDIIQLCKEYHPILWDNFMVEIEKERIVLNKLLEKFKWNNYIKFIPITLPTMNKSKGKRKII